MRYQSASPESAGPGLCVWEGRCVCVCVCVLLCVGVVWEGRCEGVCVCEGRCVRGILCMGWLEHV